MNQLKGQAAISALFTEAESNENLAKEIKAAAGPEDLAKIGLENGYEFSSAELREFIDARSEEFFLEEDGELSESELEKVAGGYEWLNPSPVTTSRIL